MAFDQMKMLQQLRKAQKQLGKEIIEVEAGDGAVVVQITGELKIKSVKIDPASVDLDDIEQLEHWVEIATVDYVFKLLISLGLFVPLYGVLLRYLSRKLVGEAGLSSLQTATRQA